MMGNERKKGWRGLLLMVLALGAGIVAAGAFVLVRPFGPSPQDGVWRVSSPEPRLVVVQADFTAVERTRDARVLGLVCRIAPRRLWTCAARLQKWRRPAWEAKLREPADWRIVGAQLSRLGFWKGATGQTRFMDGDGRTHPVYGADVLYTIFLELDRPLKDGDMVSFTTPFGNVLHFVRQEDCPTPFIKVNQVGYSPRATHRYAYLGGWLGTLGAWEPSETASRFAVIDAGMRQTVYAGTCRLRPNPGKTADGTPWTGENTQEIDFSAVTRPGTYFIRVDGVGRSADFTIGEAGLVTAVRTHLHGLFVQRCGSTEKRVPRTAWGDGPCHLKVARGTFPPDAADYAVGKDTSSGFFTADGRRVAVSHFDIIRRNTDWTAAPESFPGGWHDAADYDRRPQHLSIVADLAALALVKGADGLGPVLDETDWGLNHLRLAQTVDGGVGMWIETTRHPVEGEGMPSEDTLPYALARPTRRSSLAYAAVAAELARCSPALREKYLASAVAAWRFARHTPPATNVAFKAWLDGAKRTVFWREAPDLDPIDELKAAINLYWATGAPDYLEGVRKQAFGARFAEAAKRTLWRRSPLAVLELAREMRPEVAVAARQVRAWILDQADKRLAAQEVQPYRWPRWNGTDLAWGNAHPLVAARFLVAAHALTGEAKYLDAAFLAYDVHCGCNPDGMTLTAGLGDVYPTRFLSLASIADTVDEYVAGITPYRWTYGVGQADYELVHTQEEVVRWPIWRRRVNLESLHVPSGEYAVAETIGSALAVTAYLADFKGDALERCPPPRPRGRPDELPGHWVLP